MVLDYLSQSGAGFMTVVAGAAFADSINPCAFSILFLSIAFLLSLGKDRRFILLAGGSYILGIALVYILIGVGILQVLSFFAIPNFMAKVGAAILVAYSLISLVNEFFPSFPLKLRIPHAGHPTIGKIINRGSIPAALLLGMVVGLFEFPCTGGPYLFILSLLHDQKTFWSGFGYLLFYNVVFILPLVIILGLSTSRMVLEKVDALRRVKTKKARVMMDLALLALGALLFFT